MPVIARQNWKSSFETLTNVATFFEDKMTSPVAGSDVVSCWFSLVHAAV